MTANVGPGRNVLYRSEAQERAERVHDVSYELTFELTEDRETYAGRVVIEFRLTGSDTPLFLDMTGGPRTMTVNGTRLEPDHRDQRLWMWPDDLVTHNRVVIEFENRFDATGDGLHRFVDPEDGRVYLYSNLEPFSAHRLFPCFDQPDIKASYRLLVMAPPEWRVISAMTAAEISELPDGRRMHDFMSTPRFSTYLFSLIAGPYDRVGTEHDRLPLGIYGRASMRRELERSADEIFEITAQGLDYYADLFGRRYPFRKYDQLFVPEFNAGAMENVGAVTFHDSFLFRDPPTYSQRLVRGEVILHELAHMWFGNLVTMRWWDDLWLNETFATYLSYRSLAGATRFSDAWQVFNGQMRPAAYRQDQLVTTHPIATQVEHTDQAVGNFDAITYEKGAAVIKQLVAALGDDAFRTGLHTYFDRHAWGNATLADFLQALGDAAGVPLDDWARLWLQTPSLNTIGAHWTAEAGRITAMELQQSAPTDHDTLRPHRTSIGLVSRSAEDGSLSVDAIPLAIDDSRREVAAAVGRPAPLFVFPNHGDHDYALADLDPISLTFALERLPDLPDTLLRQQVWSTLWEMVRGATLRSSHYLETVRQFAPRETDRALVQSIIDRAAVVQRRYVPDADMQATSSALTASAIAALRGADDHDLRLIWARAAVALASSTDAIEELLDLVDGRWSVEGFEADQQLRWTLATKAVAYDVPGAADRLEVERTRDRSDRGERAAIRAGVSAPDEGVKEAAWTRIHGGGYGSDYLTRAAIMGFQWVNQREVLLRFRSPFYEHISDIYANRDHAYAESYLRWLVPDRWAEPAELDRIRSFAGDLDPEQGLLRRHLIEIADDVERDIRVREYSAATLA